MLYKKSVLRVLPNSQKSTSVGVSFLIKLKATRLRLIKKVIFRQVFSCEFWKIFKDTFFYRTPLVNCFCLTFEKIQIFKEKSKRKFKNSKFWLDIHRNLNQIFTVWFVKIMGIYLIVRSTLIQISKVCLRAKYELK